MDIFNLNKRYKFDLNTALKDNHLKANYESENAKYWMDYCDGKEVKVLGKLDGIIDTPISEYGIAPWWCEEIE